jgi:hypothetical protein
VRPLRLVPAGSIHRDRMEALYVELGHALATGGPAPLSVDLSHLSFIRPNELLVLVTVARLWHRRTG